MSSAVAELDAGLQAMLLLKPPGVSGSRINALTSLCIANVQNESVLIQKLYTHFKKAPGSHKLGVLYVVDSVTRKWTELAKSSGQTINASAEDGTYAAGVHRVTELLPVLMSNITQEAPNDHKDKIRKLVEIWEKGQTFPQPLLAQFKERLNAPDPKSTTPEGSPPPSSSAPAAANSQAPAAAVIPSNTSSILEALANMARQQQSTGTPAPAPVVPAAANPPSLSYTSNHPAPNVAAAPAPFAYPPPVTAPVATFAPPVPSNGIQSAPSNSAMPFGFAPPALQAPVNPQLQQQLAIIKTLVEHNVPQDQWQGILAAFSAGSATAGNASAPAPQYPAVQLPNPNHSSHGWSEPRDQRGYNEPVRSPGRGGRRRSRSISPQRGWKGPNSPSRHANGYDDYGRGSPARGRDDGYRQRSPARRDGGQSGPREKWVEFDHSIGAGNIKVLSRTLFVGGVTCSDQELRSIFDKFGEVQTCIVNKDKRHAFVKMVSRHDAVTAKDSMESGREHSSKVRSTRWGVGFGPRDCSDYQTGVSIIPISKLTDADRKWMLTAEYGGCGGRAIESGMVVEEPDIEIGQGVSSKAISRRMQTDKGGSNGPKSGRERDEDDFGRDRRGRDRREERDDGGHERVGSGISSALPTMPGFPYPPPGMFPPGFAFPGAPGR